MSDEHPDHWKLFPFHLQKFAACVFLIMLFVNGFMAAVDPCLLGCRTKETFLFSIPVGLGFGWWFQLLWIEGEVMHHEERRRQRKAGHDRHNRS